MLLSGTAVYGTTGSGGTNGSGSVFAVNTDGSGFTNLYNFTGGDDGAGTNAGLALLGDTLYGTTTGGGTLGFGSIFSICTNGTSFTNLYNFTGGADGANPIATLMLLGRTLYGTATAGGTNGNGTVFAINTDGTHFVVMHSFTALSAPAINGGTNIDGADPNGGLSLWQNRLIGTTRYGGTNGYGTIFSLTLPLPPQLTITPWGGNVLLTWPTNDTVYTLECATNLGPPAAWVPVSPAPAVVAGQNTVTNPVASRQMFYRLSQ